MRRSSQAVVLAIVATLSASGCVSTHMKQFIGKDVRYIEVKDGEPVRVFDLPEERRAFQYLWGGGTYVVPRTTRTSGEVQFVGNRAYYREQRLESGGVVIENPGCVITYIARWNAERHSWIVEDISYPKRAVC